MKRGTARAVGKTQDELLWACQYGTWKNVSGILDSGATLYFQDYRGHNALHHACMGHNYAVARRILMLGGEKGASMIHRMSKCGETPMIMACRLGHDDLVNLFLDFDSKEALKPGKTGMTPLHYACIVGQDAVVKQLLFHPTVDVNAKTIKEFTPLHVACNAGHVKVVRRLLEHDAKVKVQNVYGSTPLHLGVRFTNVVELLLQKGPDLNASDTFGFTALHLACRSHNADAVRMLIDRGAHLDAKCQSGCTPLHEVCQRGHLNLAKMLLEAGATVSALDEENKTPLYFACDGGHGDVVKLLLQHKAQIAMAGPSPVEAALQNGHEKIATMLLTLQIASLRVEGTVAQLLNNMQARQPVSDTVQTEQATDPANDRNPGRVARLLDMLARKPISGAAQTEQATDPPGTKAAGMLRKLLDLARQPFRRAVPTGEATPPTSHRTTQPQPQDKEDRKKSHEEQKREGKAVQCRKEKGRAD